MQRARVAFTLGLGASQRAGDLRPACIGEPGAAERSESTSTRPLWSTIRTLPPRRFAWSTASDARAVCVVSRPDAAAAIACAAAPASARISESTRREKFKVKGISSAISVNTSTYPNAPSILTRRLIARLLRRPGRTGSRRRAPCAGTGAQRVVAELLAKTADVHGEDVLASIHRCSAGSRPGRDLNDLLSRQKAVVSGDGGPAPGGHPHGERSAGRDEGGLR